MLRTLFPVLYITLVPDFLPGAVTRPATLPAFCMGPTFIFSLCEVPQGHPIPSWPLSVAADYCGSDICREICLSSADAALLTFLVCLSVGACLDLRWNKQDIHSLLFLRLLRNSQWRSIHISITINMKFRFFFGLCVHVPMSCQDF